MKMKNYLIIIIAIVLASCKTKQDAVTKVMGLDLTWHSQNKGPKPQPGEFAYFDFYLRDDGKVLQSSKMQNRVSKFRIPKDDSYVKKSPIIEMLKMLSPGDSVTLKFPVDSMPQKPRGLSDAEFVLYDVVLRDIKTVEQYEADNKAEAAERNKAMAQFKEKETEAEEKTADILTKYKSGSYGKDLVKLPSGLEYVVHEEGSGAKIKAGNRVEAHYYGVFKDNGEMFDNSFGRGQPFGYINGKGSVIQGWEEGFQQLKKGDKATFFIPYKLAYGEAGRAPTIPAKADLVFYIEVIDVK